MSPPWSSESRSGKKDAGQLSLVLFYRTDIYSTAKIVDENHGSY